MKRFLDLARSVVQRGENRDELIVAIADLLARQSAEERRRCVEVCRSRAALWRRTPSARADLRGAREEARARANEAAYIADLLEANQEITGDEAGKPN